MTSSLSSKPLFKGKVRIVLNKEVPETARKEVLDVLNSLANRYKIELRNVKVESNNIEFEITTERKIHNTALMIRNRLVANVKAFREYGIGVRDVILEDGEVVLSGEYPITIKVPLVKDVRVGEGKTVVVLTTLTESELKKPYIDNLLKLVNLKVERSKWGGKGEHWHLIKESRRKEVKFKEDPNKVLEDIGWVKYFSIGQYVYTPPFTYLLNMVKDLLKKYVLKPLGFVEATFPKMYPVEVGLKTGHLFGTINSMVFASLPASYDISVFEDLIDYMYVYQEVPKDKLRDYLREPSYFLCFAQCEPFYAFFSAEILDDADLPIKWFDQSGPSFRWEAGGLRGVERVIEFHRVEIVWLGKPEQVIEIRNQLLEKYEYFMDKVLDLEWRWALVTPWYYEQAGITEKSEEVKKVDIDRPGTIDFEVWLPYRGPRENRKNWLEIGNISIHGTKFTEPFRIKHNKKETLWTGCSGFGSERWLIAFLAQHGFNPKDWPEKVREYVEANPFPKSVTTVTYPKTAEGRKKLEEIIANFQAVSKA